MFERYTEKARRVIFFARYEASRYGTPYIEIEHILLGILREHKRIAQLLPAGAEASIDEQIAARTRKPVSIPTSVALALSNESKRVLACAADEGERLARRHIGSEHLFLGWVAEGFSARSEPS